MLFVQERQGFIRRGGSVGPETVFLEQPLGDGSKGLVIVND
jgi:hypothetical protein